MEKSLRRKIVQSAKLSTVELMLRLIGDVQAGLTREHAKLQIAWVRARYRATDPTVAANIPGTCECGKCTQPPKDTSNLN